jgi:alpha-tubulin suppressor-like RCC1 family protein
VNTSGQLGIGTLSDEVRQPSLVDLGAEQAAGIAVGFAHACVWTGAGKAFCWGLNDKFQVGDGGDTQAPRVRPVPVRLP